MKEFHITITNNETGETIHDIDSDAVLGVISDDSTWVLCLTSCDTNTILNALDRMEKAIEYAYGKASLLSL